MSRLLLAAFLLAPALLAQDQAPKPRPAADIIRDFHRVVMPSSSGGADEEGVRRFREAIEKGSAQKAKLALELFVSHPDHAQVPELMGIRWACLNNVKRDYPAVVVETTMVLENDAVGEELRHAALKARMRAVIRSELSTNRERVEAVRDLMVVHPHDEFAGMGILDIARGHLADPEVMRPLLELAVERWPDSPYVGRRAKPWLQALELVGQPLAAKLPEGTREVFDLVAGKEERFTVVQLWAGRVWPSSNGPEIEALRELRKEFGDKVRLVGLINDDYSKVQAGLAEADIDWPQVEAKGEKPWRSPLGVGPSACYYVLDRTGKIVGVVGTARAAARRLRQLAE